MLPCVCVPTFRTSLYTHWLFLEGLWGNCYKDCLWKEGLETGNQGREGGPSLYDFSVMNFTLRTYTFLFYYFLILTRGYVYWLFLFRQRGSGGREREKHTGLFPICTPTSDQTHNLGMCPEREMNPQPFWKAKWCPDQLSPLARAMQIYLLKKTKRKKARISEPQTC